RLAIEDIEVSVREMAGVELAQKVGDHQVSAAREIDDAAMLPQQREVAPIQDATGVARQRKQADQRVGDGEHRGELGKGLHAGKLLRPAAEAGDIEAEREELFRRIRAELAKPEDADGAIGCEVLLAPAPLALGLLR